MLTIMSKLSVIKSFSRPATSNDNPFSEALFKMVKYCPKYPRRPFVSVSAASAWFESFVGWYNFEHRHSGIAFVTPFQRHSGQDIEILRARTQLYNKARAKEPLRWSGKICKWEPAKEVHINPL